MLNQFCGYFIFSLYIQAHQPDSNSLISAFKIFINVNINSIIFVPLQRATSEKYQNTLFALQLLSLFTWLFKFPTTTLEQCLFRSNFTFVLRISHIIMQKFLIKQFTCYKNIGACNSLCLVQICENLLGLVRYSVKV